jgi:hypothetical protein
MMKFSKRPRWAAAIACLALLSGGPLAAQKKPAPTATPAKPAAPRTAPAPKREQPVVFAVGETLTYDVSWSSYLTAGTATVRVAEKKPSYGSTAYYIVAEGRPTTLVSKLYSLYYKVDTLLDVYTLLPQRGSLYSEEGKRHRMKTTMFYPAKKQAEYTVETRTVVKKAMAVSPVAQDPLGALYVLRSIPMKPGEKITMPICDNGQNYKVLIQAGGIEQIKTGVGQSEAQRFTMTVPADTGARALTLWLSTDAQHVPLKMSADLAVGAFVLTLSSRK